MHAIPSISQLIPKLGRDRDGDRALEADEFTRSEHSDHATSVEDVTQSLDEHRHQEDLARTLLLRVQDAVESRGNGQPKAVTSEPDTDRSADFAILRSLRTDLGLSLKTAAQRAHVSPTYIQKLERGEVRSPSPHHLFRLSRVYACDYGALMRIAGYRYPANNVTDGDGPTPRARSEQLAALADIVGHEEISKQEAMFIIDCVLAYRQDRDAGVDVPVNMLETTLRGFAELKDEGMTSTSSNGHSSTPRRKRRVRRLTARN